MLAKVHDRVCSLVLDAPPMIAYALLKILGRRRGLSDVLYISTRYHQTQQEPVEGKTILWCQCFKNYCFRACTAYSIKKKRKDLIISGTQVGKLSWHTLIAYSCCASRVFPPWT